MSAKILVLTDLHKRYKEASSIKGLLGVQQKIQEDIIQFNKENGITHNIITGDWYDRGFHGLGQAYGAIEMDRRLSRSVNGNVYLCVGNHFYLERDENPEMYIIQPNNLIRPQINIPVPEEPIFKLVERLKIGTVQIDFFHYNKINKDYATYRDSDTTYHIGIYHDDATVPGWVRERDGYSGSTSQSYMNRIYSNIDLAIHGHIHTPIGVVDVALDSGRSVPLIIPGALGITQNKEVYKHKEINLPIIEIDDNSNVTISYATFATHLSELRFYSSKKKKPVIDDTMMRVANNQVTLSNNNADLVSLPVYLRKRGYQQRHLNLIDAAVNDTLSMATAVMILAEVNKNESTTEYI